MVHSIGDQYPMTFDPMALLFVNGTQSRHSHPHHRVVVDDDDDEIVVLRLGPYHVETRVGYWRNGAGGYWGRWVQKMYWYCPFSLPNWCFAVFVIEPVNDQSWDHRWMVVVHYEVVNLIWMMVGWGYRSCLQSKDPKRIDFLLD